MKFQIYKRERFKKEEIKIVKNPTVWQKEKPTKHLWAFFNLMFQVQPSDFIIYRHLQHERNKTCQSFLIRN